jgi:membrane protease YdiL (CAAX protease family)
MNFKQTLQTNKALQFIALTYFITWAVYIPLALTVHSETKFILPRWVQVTSTLSPGIAAIALTIIMQGKKGLKKLLMKIIQWQTNIKWYLFAIMITAVCVMPSLMLYHFVLHQKLNLQEWYLPIILFFIYLPFSPLWEEIGWRGFLLPLLQKRYNPLVAASILGLIWGIWHIPIYLTLNPEGSKTALFLVYFILGAIPVTVLFTWLYNSTKGSLLLTIIFHASLNAIFSLFAQLPAGELLPFIFTMIFFAFFALIVCLTTKGQLGYSRELKIKNQEPGVKGQELGIRSQEPGIEGQEK